VIEPALEAAEARIAEPLRRPRGIANPRVTQLLGERQLFGASTLEQFGVCSYRWFVGHELDPQSLDPVDEPLAHGSLAHDVLEKLFTERPAGTALPRPENLAQWQRRAGELLAAEAARRGLDGPEAASRAAISRIEGFLAMHLSEEADAGLSLEPALFEASFGEEEDDDEPPLALGDFGIHGRIDRIDLGPTAEDGRRLALIHDYKLSGSASGASTLDKERKLQLQLYMLAAEDRFGLDPAGAVYWPLAANRDRRARGLLRSDLRESVLEGLAAGRGDWLDPDEVSEHLAAARDRSEAHVARMRAGEIERDPLDGKCPRWCTFQGVCRKERGVVEEDPAAPGDEDEDTE